MRASLGLDPTSTFLPPLVGDAQLVATHFAGNSEVTVDDKGRVAIPSKFRAAIGGTELAPPSSVFYVIPWGRALVLVTEQRFRELASGTAERISPTNAESVSRDRFFALSERVEHDPAGRISLPKELLAQYKHLVGEATMIGMDSYLLLLPSASEKAGKEEAASGGVGGKQRLEAWREDGP